MNWTLQLLPHGMVFLFRLISLGKLTSIPFAKHASQKLGFLARACGYFSSSHILTINKSQTRPSLGYCFHDWDGTPKSSLCLLDKVHSKAICLINNPSLTKSSQLLSHRRLVGDTFMGIALRRSGILFLFL